MQKHIIHACNGLAVEIKKGQTITVVDVEGGQVADFFAEVMNQPDEFLSPSVTIDCNGSLRLQTGNFIYSNRYNPMFQVVRDDVGVHDLLHPCCRPEMYDFFYDNGERHDNCLDNINRSLGTMRPIIQPVNLFMNTAVGEDGTVTVKAPVSQPGDSIVLKAKMDMRVGIAACSVSESSCNSGKCTPIKVIIEE
jgi:uncharacterized protein YcgI (DUF1989 family)